MLPKQVKQLGLSENTSMEDLCKNELVKKMIMDDMAKISKASGLNSFEQVRISLDRKKE